MDDEPAERLGGRARWTWEYGWDPARGTFYARLLAGEGAARRELAHFGSRVGEIRTSDSLMYLMGVRLPADRIAVLEHDRLTDSEEVEARPAPSPRASRLGMVSAPRR